MAKITINLIQGAVSFNFTEEAAFNLKAEISKLMDSLKAIALKGSDGTPGKPKPQKPMEFRYTGEIFLEVFCNPNIYPSPFAAKVLLTIRDERIRLTTEAELTRLIEDVEQFLAQVG